MKNKNNYDYLLADLTKLNGVGKKTMEILKKKKLIIFLTYCGDYLNRTQIDLWYLKFVTFKLALLKQSE